MPEIQKKLNELVETARLKFDAPSISTAITVNGQDFYYAAGFSDVECEVKAQTGSVYAIASSSKAFIATSLCMLAEENKLDLDYPVKKYLPDFAMYDPYMTEHLTIRDALSHRTGLPRHDLTWYNATAGTVYDTVKMLEYLPPAFPPRYRMHYQNHMFTLATVLTEKISQMPWQDFLKKRIFDPLGMTSTYATGDMLPEENPLKARPYKQMDGKTIRIPYRYITNLGCCGSIYSTVEDLIKWAKFNLYGDEGLLSGKYLTELHMPHMVIKPGDFSPTDLSPEVDLTSYGMGWFIESYRGHKMVHHGGTIDGFKSIVGMLPNDDIGFAVLSNLNRNQSPMALAYSITDMLLNLPPVDWNAKITAEFDKQNQTALVKLNETKELIQKRKTECLCLNDYAGEYSHPAYGRIRFDVGERGLELKLNIPDSPFPAEYIGGDEFVFVFDTLPDPSELLTPFCFERDENKTVSAVNMYLEEKINVPIRLEKI